MNPAKMLDKCTENENGNDNEKRYDYDGVF